MKKLFVFIAVFVSSISFTQCADCGNVSKIICKFSSAKSFEINDQKISISDTSNIFGSFMYVLDFENDRCDFYENLKLVASVKINVYGVIKTNKHYVIYIEDNVLTSIEIDKNSNSFIYSYDTGNNSTAVIDAIDELLIINK